MSGLWTLDVYSLEIRRYRRGWIGGNIAYLTDDLGIDLREADPRRLVFRTELEALRVCRTRLLKELADLRGRLATTPESTPVAGNQPPELAADSSPTQERASSEPGRTRYYLSPRWEPVAYTGPVVPPWFYPGGKPRVIRTGVRGLYDTVDDAFKARLKALRYLKNTGKTNHPNYDLTEDL